MKADGTTIILSTHNMESVEELCDNIALINKSKLIITGGLDEIRKQHGSNEVEVLYRSSGIYNPSASGLFRVVSDEERQGSRRMILDVNRDAHSAEVLSDLISKIDIISYRELIPRMNDIFIKLVTNN